MATGLAPVSLWWATPPCLALVAWLFLRAGSNAWAGWIGWAFGAGYLGLALLWIVEPFFVDPDRHAWMAPFALVFLAGGLALFWAAAFWAAFRFSRVPWLQIAALVCFWSLAEFARAYVFTGFPWAALAQIWIETAGAQWLAWIGPHGLAVLSLMACLPLALIAMPERTATARIAALFPILFTLAMTGILHLNRPETAMTGAVVRLIQPNAPQHQKWDPAMMPVFFNRQVEFTRAEPRPDLIIWPESAVPALLHNAGPALGVIADAAAGVPVAMGIQRRDGERFYNSMILLDGAGEVVGMYDKHHLVPFGEYVPFGDLAARIGLRGFAAREGDGYSAGPGPQIMDIGKMGHAIPLICYEAVFPQDVRGAPGRADFLLQVTNDAWFGQKSGPYQHLTQARMRAIEQGLPMVRAANTGVSAVIDPTGNIVESLPLGQAGYVDARMPAPLEPTLYARTGDWPVFLMLMGVALLLWRWQSNSGHFI